MVEGKYKVSYRLVTLLTMTLSWLPLVTLVAYLETVYRFSVTVVFAVSVRVGKRFRWRRTIFSRMVRVEV